MADEYNDKMSADDQISTEEEIAAYLHDIVVNEQLETEDDCNDAGKFILKTVLKKFRPDLFGG